MVQDSTNPSTTSSNDHSSGNPLSTISNNQQQVRSAKTSNKQRKKNSSHSPNSRRGSTVEAESQAPAQSNTGTDRDPAVSSISLLTHSNSTSSKPNSASGNQGEISSIFWLSICLVFSYLTFTILSYYNSKNLSLNNPTFSTTSTAAATTTITSLSNYNLDQISKQQSQPQHFHLFDSIASSSSSLPSSPSSASSISSSPHLSNSNSNSRFHNSKSRNYFLITPLSKLLNFTLSNSDSDSEMKSSNLFSSLSSFGKRASSSSSSPSPASNVARSKPFLSIPFKNDAAINVDHHPFLQSWLGSLALGFMQSFKKLAQLETILLIGLCFLTLALVAYWTNPSESSFRAYLTDSSLRQSLRQLETEDESSQKSSTSRSRHHHPPSHSTIGSTIPRSPSDDELEQQLNYNVSSNECSNPSITFAHKISLSLKTPPYVKRDGKFYTVMTVKHAKKSRGGSSLNPSQNRFQKKPFHSSFPPREAQLNGQATNQGESSLTKENQNQCPECGFRSDINPESTTHRSVHGASSPSHPPAERSMNQVKNHEHVSWYLGAFGTWWLVAQGWEIDEPSPSKENLTTDQQEPSFSMDSKPQVHSLVLNPSASSGGSMTKKSRKNWSRENLKEIQWKRELELKKKLNDYGVLEMKVLKDEDQRNDLQNLNLSGQRERGHPSCQDPNRIEDGSPSASDARSSRRKRGKARGGKGSTPAQEPPKNESPHSKDFTPDPQDHIVSSATTSNPRLLNESQSALHESPAFHPDSHDDLSASLAAAQATNADLEAQLAAVQQTSSSSRSQLNAQLEALRARKKEEDASRSEIKTKMKSLDESKRQAEATKRDSERRLKAITGVRNAIQSKIDNHRKERENLKDRIVQREKKLIEAEKESEKEELEFKKLESERLEMKSKEDSDLEELQTKVALLNGKLQEHQANLEAAKALALERQAQMQAEAVAQAKAQAEAKAAHAQARAHAKAQAQAQAHHAQIQLQAQQAAQHAAALNANNLPLTQSSSSSNIYPLLSGPGDFPPSRSPYDMGWVSEPASQHNQMASVPINLPGGSFLSPLDLSAARDIPIPAGLRGRELSTSSSSGAFSPPLNSPFYTDLLPSNLFASADEDDDLRGVLPGRARSATLEEALGRFGLASSESGASEDNDEDVQRQDSDAANLSREEDSLGQGQIMEEPDSFSDAIGDGDTPAEADEQDQDDSFADAPSSRVTSPTQSQFSPQEGASTPILDQAQDPEEQSRIKSPLTTSPSSPKVEEEDNGAITTSSRSRSMRRPGSKGSSAGRTWWGKSRSESVARSDVTAEAEERNEESKDRSQDENNKSTTANEGNESSSENNRRSRTFSVTLPKLSLNPAAKAFKSASKNSRPSPTDNSSLISYPMGGRPIAPNHRLGSGGWNGTVPSAPITDYEAVRRAFEASGFPPEDEDEQGRRSWSAFDSWQAHQGGQQQPPQSQAQTIGAIGGVGQQRPYFSSQTPSPLMGGRSHLFSGLHQANNEWGMNPRSSSDSLPYSFNQTQAAAPSSSSAFGNPLLDGVGMNHHHHHHHHRHQNGSLSPLQSSGGMSYQQQGGLAGGNRSNLNNHSSGRSRPTTTSSWLSDDEMFNPLARSISAGDLSSTSLGSNSISNNSNTSGNSNSQQQAARSRFAFWNRKNQSQSDNVGSISNGEFDQEEPSSKEKENKDGLINSASLSPGSANPYVAEGAPGSGSGVGNLSSVYSEFPPRTPDLQVGTGSTSQEATPTGPQTNSSITPSKKRSSFRWTSAKRDSSASVNQTSEIAE